MRDLAKDIGEMWDSSVTWTIFFGLSLTGIPCFNSKTDITKATTCTVKGGYEGKLGKLEVDVGKGVKD